MNKKDKIDTIYKEIANKELTRWCVIKKHVNEYDYGFVLNTGHEDIAVYYWHAEICDYTERFCIYEIKKEEIIWCPVMLWDVLERAYENVDWYWKYKLQDVILNMRKHKKEPIEENHEVVDFIYELVNQWNNTKYETVWE